MKKMCFMQTDLNLNRVDELARFGLAWGAMTGGKKVGVAWDGQKSAEPACRALAAGLLDAGCAVLNFGYAFQSQAEYYFNRSNAESNLFLSVQKEGRLWGYLPACGLLPQSGQSRLLQIWNQGDFLTPEVPGRESRMDFLERCYLQGLLAQLTQPFQVGIKIQCEGAVIRNTMEDILFRHGCFYGDDWTVVLEQSGKGVSLRSKQFGRFSQEELFDACVQELEGAQRQDFFAPVSREKHAGQFPWAEDSLYLTLRFFSLFYKRQMRKSRQKFYLHPFFYPVFMEAAEEPFPTLPEPGGKPVLDTGATNE